MSNFHYAPGVTDQRGAIMAEGIRSAGNSLTSTIEQLTKRREEDKQMQGQAKAIETLLPLYGKTAGVDQTQIDAMLAPSPDESPRARLARLSQAMEGLVTTQTLKSKALNDQHLQTLIAGEQQRQAEIERQRTEGDAQRGRLRAMFGGQPSLDEMGGMIQQGANFQDLAPSAQPPASASDAMRGALAAGIEQPRLLDAIGRYAGPRDSWQPSIVDLGGGVTGMMTSPRSAIPVTKPSGKNGAYPNGPVYSPDKQFVQSGPNEPWKPVPNRPAGAKLDPMLVGTINEQINQLEAEKLQHQQAMATGDNRFGFANINSRATRLQEIESRLAGLRATLRAGGKSDTAPATEAPDAPRFKILQVQ